MRQGFTSARRAVVLVRNCFSQHERFSVQRSRLFDNGAGPVPAGWRDAEIIYPHRTVVEAEVIQVAEAAGFSLRSRLEEHSGAILPNSYGCQLVFWRRQ
jgi:hypothetical protein